MKTARGKLIFVILFLFFSSTGLSEAKLPLSGLKEFYVTITEPIHKPEIDGLVWAELTKKIENKLEQASIKFVQPRSLPTPILDVHVVLLKMENSEKYVYHIQTFLKFDGEVSFPSIYFSKKQSFHIQVIAWQTEAVMKVVSLDNMSDSVTDDVLIQIDNFIIDYLTANPKSNHPTDVNEVKAVSQKKRAKPVVHSSVAEYRYVASRNSKVFHKLDCSSVARIKKENQVNFQTKNSALNTGRRPCKICKP